MERQSTQASDFTLLFESVMSSGGNICLHDHIRNKESNVRIAIDDSEFSYRIQKEFPSIIADLIDLAVAIHTADRLIFQSLRQQQTRIHVVLPVRHPEILNQSSFQGKLFSLLEWATGSRWSASQFCEWRGLRPRHSQNWVLEDCKSEMHSSRWVFEFSKRVDLGRAVEQQPLLTSSDPYINEVVLWSGGLDALAGLYTSLKENRQISFMLFGTGSNDNAYSRQEQIFQALLPSFPIYQTYVLEWDAVEPQISGDFLNQVIDQPVSQDFQMAIQ
jgi:hypothetical protein